MDAIQRLRTKARCQQQADVDQGAEGHVKHRTSGKQVIVIEPTDPKTVYVPYYDPAVVYGAWPYPEYPPYYFPDARDTLRAG